jgi:glyoxylase-like metal-dependent hydrolase (beta-lactamase superfamily II)
MNAYLVGDVLVDAGGRNHAGRILKALAGRVVTQHALTHVHPDHQGSSHELATTLGLSFAVPAGEAREAERGEFGPVSTGSLPSKFFARVSGGPGHPVDRPLAEGDEVGGFTVVALPGHSPDHVGYWRERDRVLIAGDGMRNISYRTGRPYPSVSADTFNWDKAGARRSLEKLAGLRPSIIAVGHGRPIVGDTAVQRALELALSRPSF